MVACSQRASLDMRHMQVRMFCTLCTHLICPCICMLCISRPQMHTLCMSEMYACCAPTDPVVLLTCRHVHMHVCRLGRCMSQCSIWSWLHELLSQECLLPFTCCSQCAALPYATLQLVPAVTDQSACVVVTEQVPQQCITMALDHSNMASVIDTVPITNQSAYEPSRLHSTVSQWRLTSAIWPV